MKTGTPAMKGFDHDVAVIGAGMVGASVAIGLANLGLKVLLLDRATLSFQAIGEIAFTPSFDDRSTALAPSTVSIFRQLGVWESLEGFCSSIDSIHVSEKGKMGVTRLASSDYELPALGYVCPNRALGSVLLSEVAAHANIDLLAPSEIQSTDLGEEGVTIRYSSNNEEFDRRIKVMVITDGAYSRTAQQIGIQYVQEDYQQTAIVTNVESELAHENCAYERFTDQGPLALLPLAENVSSLVWTVPSSELDPLLELSDQQFLKSLHQVFGDRLGRFVQCGQRVSYPLSLTVASDLTRPRAIVLGNAAQSLHPVAGQGFNLALRGVGAFVERVGRAVSAGDPIDHPSLMREASERHQNDRRQTISLSGTLLKTFSSRSLPVQVFRELGLVGLSNTPWAKKSFVERAMGVAEPGFDLGGQHG